MTLKKAGGIATIVSVVFGVGWALWIYFSPPKSNAPSTAQTAVVKGDDNVVVQGNKNVVNPPSAAGLMKRSEVDDSLIPGIWFAEYSYAGAKGSMNKLQTTMEYFENGRYRVDGQQAVTAYEHSARLDRVSPVRPARATQLAQVPVTGRNDSWRSPRTALLSDRQRDRPPVGLPVRFRHPRHSNRAARRQVPRR